MCSIQLKEPVLCLTRLQPYPCHYCVNVFYTPSRREAHRNAAHGREIQVIAGPDLVTPSSSSPSPDQEPSKCEASGSTCSLKADAVKHASDRSSVRDQRFRRNDVDELQFQFASAAVKSLSNPHEEAKQFECLTCGKEFDFKSRLQTHMVTHNGERPFECSTCGMNFGLKGHLKRHMVTHSGERPFECSTCGRNFGLKGHLKRHMASHCVRVESPFECSTCGKNFGFKGQLKRHMASHCVRVERPFKCSTCGEYFIHEGHLERHTMTTHGHNGGLPTEDLEFEGGSSNITGDGDVKPDIGPLKDGSDGSKLLLIPNTVNQRFQRKEVELQFASAAVKWLSSPYVEVKPFECYTCGKKFDVKSRLKTHMVTHSQEKAYECSICGKKYTLKFSLKGHMVTHSGERPFECSTCGKTFIQKGHLKKHMASHCHRVEKPFKCAACGENFIHEGHLKSHIMTSHGHNGNLPFENLVFEGGSDSGNSTGDVKPDIDSSSMVFVSIGEVEPDTGSRVSLSTIDDVKPDIDSIHLYLGSHLPECRDDSDFKCELCDSGFSTKDMLMTHIKSYHTVLGL